MPEPSLLLVIILGLAFVGLLALGFYERRQSHRFAIEAMQRLSMTLQTAVSARSVAAASAPESSPFPPVPPLAASSGDLSDDAAWNQVNAEWAREALVLRQHEEARAELIQKSLREAQARKAAELAAAGQLGDFPETAEQSVPSDALP